MKKPILLAGLVAIFVTAVVLAQQNGSGIQLTVTGYGGGVVCTNGGVIAICLATNGLNIVSTTIQCTGGVACAVLRGATNSTEVYYLAPGGSVNVSEPARDNVSWYGQGLGGVSYVTFARTIYIGGLANTISANLTNSTNQ